MDRLFRSKKAIGIGVASVIAVAGIIAVLFVIARKNDAGPAPDPTVLAGQGIVVTVAADSLEDVYGYQFQMNYDESELEYAGGLASKIEGITTIFAKPFEGYQLVGATMVGDRAGFSGEGHAVCEMAFTAKRDGALSGFAAALSISDINVVTSDLEYKEGVEGWSVSLSPSASASG